MMLGCLVFDGNGVRRDRVRASRLYRRAAELGNDRAHYLLGLCYRDGDGVRRDRCQARAWLTRAAHLGDVEARQELRRF